MVTPFLLGKLRRDRRPVDARQRFQHEARDGHQRTGVAGRDAGVGRAVLHQVDGDAERRVLLLAQRVGGRLVHVDDFARRVHRQPLARGRFHAGDQGIERRPQAYQNDAGIRCRFQERDCRGHRDRGAVVAPHRVDGYGYGHVEVTASGIV